uniref:Uncharacterized protein n=1 Tax=Arundo donax TaxID=35708 RepID=A0A0A8XUZ5_ARUDO
MCCPKYLHGPKDTCFLSQKAKAYYTCIALSKRQEAQQ